MGRSGPLCFVFFSLSKFPPIGPANGQQRASSVWPASTQIIGLCLSLSINHGLTGSESPGSAVNHNRNQGGLDLMAWAGVVGVGTELKMDKRKKRPGGAEKLRLSGGGSC